ncbi:hypothetical protein BG006_009041, partial [Podila minutissima]
TQNVVHDILLTATSTKPIALKSPLMKKTPKMVSIDTNLKWQARDEFQETQKEITKNNNELLEIRNKICELDNDYKSKDQVVNSTQIQKNASDRDDLEVLFHDKSVYNEVKFTEISSRTMVFKKQDRMIEGVSIQSNNIDIEQSLGGKGFNHWKIIYRRSNFKEGSLFVTLYARKRGNNDSLVGETKEMTNIRLQRAELDKKMTEIGERIRSKWHLQKEYNLLRDWISRETLPKAVMEELIKEEVYEAKETPFDKIRAIYLKSDGVYDTDPCEPLDEPKTNDDDGEEYLKGAKYLSCSKMECVCALKECDCALKDKDPSQDEVKISSAEPSTYSILFLGQIQSGKTTLIESLRKHAHPDHIVNKKIIGDGIYACTRDVKTSTIYTNLPSYFISKAGVRVDHDSLVNHNLYDED